MKLTSATIETSIDKALTVSDERCDLICDFIAAENAKYASRLEHALKAEFGIYIAVNLRD